MIRRGGVAVVQVVADREIRYPLLPDEDLISFVETDDAEAFAALYDVTVERPSPSWPTG
jgi:hypothetical protein